MKKKQNKPSRWTYGLAVLTVLASSVLAMIVVYRWFPGLPGTLGSLPKPGDLTRVVVPGSREVTFDRGGAYAVYYESRSVVDGVAYRGSKTPPDLLCTLTSGTSGADVPVVPDHVEGNAYSTKDRGHVGVLMSSVSIDEPGSYRFSCGYADGKSQPQVVLAIGPNLVWEFLSIAARPFLTVAAGLTVLVWVAAIWGVVALAAAVKRHRPPATAIGS